ncbi:hypothetical protein Taro_040078 [Colocasia esculenta]|uniref:Trypsin inhibitor n=1 Tax=Colocasia esculenta TaxID=4460 RepID=A0A843WKQ9_COLES|nr:hypothetical protein [Colocasia esculenta]
MEFMLLCVSALLLTARAATASSAVLDVDGNELQRGQRYYAMSSRTIGGGLTTVAIKGTCPLYVSQAPLHDRLGSSLSFVPEDLNEDTVREGNTLYIMFNETPAAQCSESTMWTLDNEGGYVTTGGTNSTSLGPHYSRFAIRKVGNLVPDYQVHPCPCSIGVPRPSCRMACLGSLGFTREGNNVLLGLNGDRAHSVVFVKEEALAAATASIR